MEHSFTTYMVHIAKAMKLRFVLNQQSVSHEDVFSEIGFLPAIMRRADQLASFCMGYGLGVLFNDTQDAKQGVRVEFEAMDIQTLRLLCAVEILHELMRASPQPNEVQLDDLLYD